MTLKETVELSKQQILELAWDMADIVSEETNTEVAVEGWIEQHEPESVISGTYSPMMRGEIARFIIGSKDTAHSANVLLYPGKTGTIIRIHKELQISEWLCWADVDHPAVPYDKKISCARFCIGGNNIPGSGFLVRIVLDTSLGALRMSLPTDPGALESIQWI